MSRNEGCPNYLYQMQSGDSQPPPPAAAPPHVQQNSVPSYAPYNQYTDYNRQPQGQTVEPYYNDPMLQHSSSQRGSRGSRYDSADSGGYKDRTDSQYRGQGRPVYESKRDYQSSSYSSEQRDDGEQFETQVDTVFVQNLPLTCTREEVSEVFGSIGVIKIDKKTGAPKVWIYKDKLTGAGKGEATVTYDDPESANAAIRWFDQKEVLGQTVTVTLAFRKRAATYQQRNKRGSRGSGGRGGDGRSDYYGGKSDFSGPMRRHTGGRDRNTPY